MYAKSTLFSQDFDNALLGRTCRSETRLFSHLMCTDLVVYLPCLVIVGLCVDGLLLGRDFPERF